MREFKVGDKVKIPSKPDSKWVGEDYLWAEEMDETCGVIFEVSAIVADFDGSANCVELDSLYTYRPEYLLTEPYNQESNMKEIDLTKEQVFTEPLEGYVFDNHHRGSLKAIMKDDTGQIHFFDEECGRWSICEEIDPPKPEKVQLTHFEILKMDIITREKGFEVLSNFWNTAFNIEACEYCLKSDFQKAPTLEDVVWLKLERDA